MLDLALMSNPSTFWSIDLFACIHRNRATLELPSLWKELAQPDGAYVWDFKIYGKCWWKYHSCCMLTQTEPWLGTVMLYIIISLESRALSWAPCREGVFRHQTYKENGQKKKITMCSNLILAKKVSGKSASVWRQNNACKISADNITEHSVSRFRGQILKCYLTDCVWEYREWHSNWLEVISARVLNNYKPMWRHKDRNRKKEVISQMFWEAMTSS